jgi:hypothetical protein
MIYNHKRVRLAFHRNYKHANENNTSKTLFDR